MPHLRISTTTLRYKNETFMDLLAQPLYLLNAASWVTPAITHGAEELPGKMTQLGARLHHCLSH